jgi:hypothetical protein
LTTLCGNVICRGCASSFPSLPFLSSPPRLAALEGHGTVILSSASQPEINVNIRAVNDQPVRYFRGLALTLVHGKASRACHGTDRGGMNSN